MKKSVTIIDYGLGNLHSVANALRYLGAEVIVAETGKEISKAGHLILPGVGAFSDGMQGLRERNQIKAVHEYAARNQGPLMGICLGAQLLLSESDEFGRSEGLGIVPGRVRAVPSNGQKIPHVGWKPLRLNPQHSPQTMIQENACVYFVHSYHAVPDAPEDIIATVSFGEEKITAVLGRGRVTGCQFHPEKSGATGLKILEAFLNS